MAAIKKKIKGKQTYYYLEHSFRDKRKVLKKEMYLGKEIPKNIEEIKKEFIQEILKNKWFNQLDNIKRNFSKEQKKTPLSAKKKEIENFMIRFTYDSNRIEGSTLSLRDTANLLERGITPKEKPIEDIKETESHKKVFYLMMNHKKELSMQSVLYWHKSLFDTTKRDIAGKIRKHQVAISGSKFMPPLPVEVYLLLNEFFKWYNKNKDKMHPVELAALVHLKFVTVHPFADGNGRISRIMMNFVLQKHKFPMLDIHYTGRTSYYNALERSQMKKNEVIFIQWFFRKYLKEHKMFLTK